MHCSNDPLRDGDPARCPLEDLLLSAHSDSHMLWYLHCAGDAGIVVTSHPDNPVGVGEVGRGGAARFVKAALLPHVTLKAGADLTAEEVILYCFHEVCFIARSVNFPLAYAPTSEVQD